MYKYILWKSERYAYEPSDDYIIEEYTDIEQALLERDASIKTEKDCMTSYYVEVERQA